MIFVDSGYLIALAVRRDSLHERALRWSRGISEPLLVTEYVLWETINYLSPLADRPKAQVLLEQVRTLPAFEYLEADRGLFAGGMTLHEARRDKTWSLTDCISFQVMQQRGVTRALAYDVHFEQAGFEALLRREPPA